MEDGELLFTYTCDEPKIGKIERKVYNVAMTVENLEQIYIKASKFNHIMGFEIPTKEHFILFFLKPTTYKEYPFHPNGIIARIDDFVGIFWLSDIDVESMQASIHYTFFDRRHKGRLGLCKRAIKYVFDRYGFNQLTTMVPLYMRQPKDGDKKEVKLSVMDFVEQIGFHKEARLRDKIMYRGQMFDANLYVIKKQETDNGWLNTELHEPDQHSIKSGESA